MTRFWHGHGVWSAGNLAAGVLTLWVLDALFCSGHWVYVDGAWDAIIWVAWFLQGHWLLVHGTCDWVALFYQWQWEFVFELELEAILLLLPKGLLDALLLA